MGMGKMFSNSAEFNDLLEQAEPLKVSKVVHKAFIEVNEEGAEAAAATGRHFHNDLLSFMHHFPFHVFLSLCFLNVCACSLSSTVDLFCPITNVLII